MVSISEKSESDSDRFKPKILKLRGGHDDHLAGLRDLIRPELLIVDITKKLIIFTNYEENGEFGGRRVRKSQLNAGLEY